MRAFEKHFPFKDPTSGPNICRAIGREAKSETILYALEKKFAFKGGVSIWFLNTFPSMHGDAPIQPERSSQPDKWQSRFLRQLLANYAS